jgi:hypothetical protein
MGVPALTTNFVGFNVTFTETLRKAAINALYRSCQDARMLEEWLQMQPQRFVMLGIYADSYNDVLWVSSQVFEPLNCWLLNLNQHASILDYVDSLVAEIRKTSLLPNIRDYATNAMFGLTEGSLSYAKYTFRVKPNTHLEVFLLSSRYGVLRLHCVNFQCRL